MSIIHYVHTSTPTAKLNLAYYISDLHGHGEHKLVVRAVCGTQVSYMTSNFVVEALFCVTCDECRVTEAFRNKLLENELTK